MNTDAVATALRVLGTAVSRDLVVDRPTSVIIYGRKLEPSEISWLFRGMTGVAIEQLTRSAGVTFVEDVQIVGTILGREYRVLLFEVDVPHLLASLRIELAARARPARAKAGAR